MPRANKYVSHPPRKRLTPPHASLTYVRKAAGLTIDALCARINDEFPELTIEKGTISAIERGHRGASEQMLRAMSIALNLPPDALTTTYQPRQSTSADAKAAVA